ncbi:M48 family metallopeptidase [Acinetobacter rudis]|uniref:SprT family zinc-dependent metalloprotease n=1 Tax=Acinetobacter rudis TaxID=632955 RepID=A0AAW8JA62_9GAMM|nr:SprT family zinc-dependent metalloprotease [Acinetobacter rudis]MDQ8935823.1 SprT family zinc-dependent metalloprotease [Acinetobacter rudis]MDQ9018139.1 SprT family zinc-dependent metalloprotease [Acinetobacter rudis]
MSITQDLPEIQIVRHARAKRLRLRVFANSIRLTVPLLCSSRQIDLFLKQSESWLVETWQKQQIITQEQPQNLPEEICLFDSSVAIQIDYVEQKEAFIYFAEKHTVRINQTQAELNLKAFILFYAKHKLPQYLKQLSLECALPFAKCNIRHAKTRWGSCNQQHDIMLNAALVLYPQHIVRYVCIHELAHTRYFNHSLAFWSELEKYDGAFKAHRKFLKTSALPYWWHNVAKKPDLSR